MGICRRAAEQRNELATFQSIELHSSPASQGRIANWTTKTRELPLVHSDSYLNDLLVKYCEAALTDRNTKVENAIASVLPHGKLLVEDVARSLGISERTLARKLSDDGLNFTQILQQLRRDLALRYLDDRKLPVSKIAWLLGFREVSAFTHAYKRWTGKTPRQIRTASAY